MAKKGSKKNSHQNTTYKATNRRLKNKIRNLKRHIGRFPDDRQAEQNLSLILENKPGVKGKRTWARKYKRDTSSSVKNNDLFMYRVKI